MRVDPGHVAFNADTGALQNINDANGNLERLVSQLPPVLPDSREAQITESTKTDFLTHDKYSVVVPQATGYTQH